MLHYSFVATETLECDFLNDLETRFDFQETIALESFIELEMLLTFFGCSLVESPFVDLVDVEGSWLLSGKVLSFSKADFDDFYEQWLKVSGRENSMDEYGQLLHLNNFFSRVNSANHKVVLQESI